MLAGNDFERRFAAFLDRADDVVRFTAVGATERGAAGVPFRVDYLKPDGAVGFYCPDWFLVSRKEDCVVRWIVETGERELPGAEEKDAAMHGWCDRVAKMTGDDWGYLRIHQRDFDAVEADCPTFGALYAELAIRAVVEFRRKYLIKPMTLEEIREAINEGRE